MHLPNEILAGPRVREITITAGQCQWSAVKVRPGPLQWQSTDLIREGDQTSSTQVDFALESTSVQPDDPARCCSLRGGLPYIGLAQTTPRLQNNVHLRQGNL